MYTNIQTICTRTRGRLYTLDVRFDAAAPDPVEELLPTVERLATPDPEGTGDADDEAHQVLDHEHLEVRLAADVARDRTGDAVRGVTRTHVHVPRDHPVVEVALLVEQAGDHDQRRHRIEDGEDADANHELLQFVGLGAVVLHDGADAEQRDEAGEEEYGAEGEVDEQRGEDEAAEGLHVPQAHVAHARQDVAFNFSHRKYSYGFDSRNCPCCKMEVLRIRFDGFMSPL